MAKKEKMLEDLFHETLKDIYYGKENPYRASEDGESCPVRRVTGCF